VLTKKYVKYLLDWASTEIVGAGPLQFRGLELIPVIVDGLNANDLETVQYEVASLRSTLEQLRDERRAEMSRDNLGYLIQQIPEVKDMLDWIANPRECLVPEDMREWAIHYLGKGESYAFLQ
jgi:hypothetical protein